MRFFLAVVFLLLHFQAQADATNPEDVLRQQYRLLSQMCVEMQIHEAFPRAERNLSTLLAPLGRSAKLLVIPSAEPFAAALQDGNICISVAFAQADTDVQLFVLGHELGHLELHHHAVYLQTLEGLNLAANPDSLTFYDTNGALQLISPTSHRCEFAADAFSMQLLSRLDLPLSGARRIFETFVSDESVSHPSSRARLEAAFHPHD